MAHAILSDTMKDAQRGAMSGVTVVGSRQTGKTEMFIALTDWLIRTGQNVVYVAVDMRMARHVMMSLEKNAGNGSYTVHRSNGRERISHQSGGEATFTSVRSDRARGLNCDTLILDEVDAYPANAKFIYHAPLADEDLPEW